jgi:hypothetical protein
LPRLQSNGLHVHDRASLFLELAADIMARDLKDKWFRALLRQDMAFLDFKDVSGTATIISSNGARFKK